MGPSKSFRTSGPFPSVFNRRGPFARKFFRKFFKNRVDPYSVTEHQEWTLIYSRDINGRPLLFSHGKSRVSPYSITEHHGWTPNQSRDIKGVPLFSHGTLMVNPCSVTAHQGWTHVQSPDFKGGPLFSNGSSRVRPQFSHRASMMDPYLVTGQQG